ncbi:Flagellar hook-associated protein FliD [Chitinispirillum alkaliphilum]|nr:Flagellar hook-associated protein FliD [Chitinispirillum alkaliphilum]
MSGISINGPSGIDTGYIIDSLVNIERGKVRAVEQNKSAFQVRIDAYSQLQSILNDLSGKVMNMSRLTSFDQFNTSSTNESVATITGGTGSVDGSYDVRVFQTAENEKMISGAGRVSSQNTALSELGVTVGTISIDEIEININETDTLQDLRMKINNATDENGRRINVSASVMRVSDDDFRMVLTSRTTGSSGIEYRDIDGSTLQDLGIILDADGDKGNVNQQLRSSFNAVGAFDSVATGQAISFEGTDHNGNIVSNTFIKDSSATIDDFLRFVENTYNGMVQASVDENGAVVLTDSVSGRSQLTMSSITFGSSESQALDTDVVGVNGAGVLSVGRDAYFSVENINMTSNTNTASGFIEGVTLELHNASTERVRVSLDRDHAGIADNFKEILSSYNELLKFVRNNTKVGDPTDARSRRGNLAGDMTVNNILSQVSNVFRQQFDVFGGDFKNLTNIGLTTDPKSGELSLNEEIFKDALETNLDEVMRLFVTTGVSSSGNVSMGNNSRQTQTGKYIIEEVDETHFRIKLEGSDEWFISDPRTGSIVTFSEGPAKGLSLTAPAGSLDGQQANFTFSQGLTGSLDNIINSITHHRDGLISMRQESWRSSIKRADQQILRLEDRIERYRMRLVKQFSDMEQAMASLQAQSAQMFSNLNS